MNVVERFEADRLSWVVQRAFPSWQYGKSRSAESFRTAQKDTMRSAEVDYWIVTQETRPKSAICPATSADIPVRDEISSSGMFWVDMTTLESHRNRAERIRIKFWVLDSGFPVAGFGLWAQDSGCRVSGFGFEFRV